MFTNHYHIASFRPGMDREEMTVGRERLARQLVKSGKLRIDAGEKINFARLYIPQLSVSMMFSYRELYDPTLLPKTKDTIRATLRGALQGASLEAKLEQHLKLLKNELNKYTKVPLEEELKLARLIVQATHPVVMMMILAEGVEIFISHSHNIGDVLDIVTWKTAGSNSGMQSTNGVDAAIFISCGGNPLEENENLKAEHGDGWPARARILVIGGQELGHYSDIMRDSTGRQISRYSANFSATKAKDDVKASRRNDVRYGIYVRDKLKEMGLHDLIMLEKRIKFFQDLNPKKFFTIEFMIDFLKLIFMQWRFTKKAKEAGITFLEHIKNDPRMGTLAIAIVEDMLFNLSPKADVYQKGGLEEEEAIACVEALARVPQQVNKWGAPLTKIFMKNLYLIYYKKVIPGCITAYQNMTGKKYEYNSEQIKPGILYWVKSLFKKKPFYPKIKSSLLK